MLTAMALVGIVATAGALVGLITSDAATLKEQPAPGWAGSLTLISLPVLLAVAVGVLGHRRRARYRHPTQSPPPNLNPEFGFSEYV